MPFLPPGATIGSAQPGAALKSPWYQRITKAPGRHSCSFGGSHVKVFFTVLPFVSAAVSFVFAALVFRRYALKRGPHLLLWGIGMTMYGVGGFCEGYFGAFGWNPLVFRLWYLFGAMLVAA